ncbi:hypothetical protein [Actinoplanes regularis]|uniref:Uncharacterized protein n=1 Tax=Actinoplanes regularis TaxID=52697 RepID=A0A239JZ25_9ACTN|nr:hypothetical protein [Actinoplanes regularis]GIE92373.1 hypothetical protein Are01nite_88530 [Actinoplanes regularis]SNT10879.1 hypothetical protein SAMN06264365_14011 [Actinoplanes regularis]
MFLPLAPVPVLVGSESCWTTRSAPGSASKCDKVNRQAELAKAEAAAQKVVAAYSRPEYATQDQTVAVLTVCNIADGLVFSYFGGRPNLEPKQVAAGAGLAYVINVGNAVHAEPLVITEAKKNAAGSPVSPIVIYASNPFCGADKENCKLLVGSEPGAQILPTSASKRKSRAAIYAPGIVWP